MLLREAILDTKLNQYNILIIDEAHERTVNSDVLLGLLKSISKIRPKLKLIIMSATIGIIIYILELNKFKHYFNCNSVYEIEGRCHPIGIYYCKNA